MIINTATRTASKLLSKSIGHSVNENVKVLGEQGLSILAPARAKTYDVVSGIGKKGEFQLFSFKDENGKTIQHYTRYFKNNNKYTDVVIDTDISTGTINRVKKTINGVLNGNNSIEKIEHSSLLPFINPVDNKLSFQKSFMTMTPTGDFGGQKLLRQGKNAVGFKHNYGWNGEPINIEYKNTLGQKLDLTEAEAKYLPFVHRRIILVEQNGQKIVATQDFCTDRINEKIGLAQIIQEKVHGIKEGFLPKAKAVKQDDLVAVKVTGKTAEQRAKEGSMTFGGEALPNGQIHIAVDAPLGTDGLVILDRVAHEVQHEADFIAMNKGGEAAVKEALNKLGKTTNEVVNNIANERKFYDYTDFYNKCIKQNGTFPKGTPEYDEAVKLYEMNLGATNLSKLTNEAAHDAMPFEQRAINREHEQMNIYTQISTKVGNFLNQFLG